MGDFDQYRISNEDLRSADVPGPDASYDVVEKFALSYDGYEHRGSFSRCANIANRYEASYRKNRSVPNTLDDLRTCLFFEQRRWRHVGAIPEGAAMRYIRALLTEIKRLVNSSGIRPKKAASLRVKTRSGRAIRS